MTKAELMTVFAKLSVAYPNFGSNQNVEMLTEVWYEALHQFPYELVQMAIKDVISTSKFIPTIAEVKEIIFKQNTLHGLSFDEAWKYIIKASHDNDYFLGGFSFVRAYNNLPREAKALTTIEDIHQIAMSSDKEVEYLKNQLRKKFNDSKEQKKTEFLTAEQPLLMIPYWETKLRMNTEKENQKLLGGRS